MENCFFFLIDWVQHLYFGFFLNSNINIDSIKKINDFEHVLYFPLDCSPLSSYIDKKIVRYSTLKNLNIIE